MKKKSGLKKVIVGAVLIVIQILLLVYYSSEKMLYFPSGSDLNLGRLLLIAVYYIGYFMIGIVGVCVLLFGIFEIVNAEKYARFISKKAFSSSTAIIYPVAFGIFLLAHWQNGVLLKVLNTSEVFLPKPTKIMSVFFDMTATTEWSTAGEFTFSPDMGDHIISSLKISIIGLICGSLLGYLVALVATVFKKWGKGGLTVVSVFNAIPIVALAPVMLYWTKIMEVSTENGFRSMLFKIMVVTLFCTATMSVNAYRGLTELRPFSEDLLKTYACKKATIFFKLRFPNSIPYVFTALKVSLPLSIIATLVSEYFGDADVALGIGRMIKENIVNSQFTTAWVYIAIACIMGIILYAVLMAFQSILLKNRKA